MESDGGFDLDDLRRHLTAEVALLSETLFGAPNRSMSTRQQLRFGSNGSMAVELHRNRGTWFSHEAGIGGGPLDMIAFALGGKFVDAVAWARSWTSQAPQPRSAPASRHNTPRNPNDMWRSIWAETQSTGLKKYLAARGCTGRVPSALRFHPACPRGASERLPAMVALMTDPATNLPTGIHRTFLRPDNAAKVEHGTAKMMLGNAGVIRLAPDEEVTAGLGICEGIETGLGLINCAEWSAIWAAGSAGGIAKFPVLRGIECLTIFPDRDDAGAGERAAAECAARWQGAGHEVNIIWPPAGADWLDALKVAA